MTTGFQAFELGELQSKQANRAYVEFLRREGMSVGLYVLPVDGQDQQHPHASDELYVVQSGAATLRVGEQDQSVQAGSIISVDRGVEHRFVDIKEDLHIVVIFAPAASPDD